MIDLRLKKSKKSNVTTAPLTATFCDIPPGNTTDDTRVVQSQVRTKQLRSPSLTQAARPSSLALLHRFLSRLLHPARDA